MQKFESDSLFDRFDFMPILNFHRLSSLNKLKLISKTSSCNLMSMSLKVCDDLQFLLSISHESKVTMLILKIKIKN